MAKKGIISEVLDAAKSVGGAALGAAAVAATGVVVTSVAGALRSRGEDLEQAAPQIQKLAGDTVSKPLLPKKQKRAAATMKAKAAKKKAAAKRASKKPSSRGRKKR